MPWAGGRVGQLKTRWGKPVRESKQVSLKEFPGRVDIGENGDGRSVLKLNRCLKTLPANLSEMPDSTVLMGFSNNSQKDVYSDKHVVR